MTSELRKLHKRIWVLLLLIIPFLMVLVIKDLSFQPPKHTNKIQDAKVENLSENDMLKASLIHKDTTYFIQIILKQPLKHPSSNIYTVVNGEKGNFIGQINAVGIYSFEVEDIPKGIMLYDDIKKNVITKMNL